MIKNIELHNFRRLENFKFDINKNIVLITGANASGKTSILEAVYLCSFSKSHRSLNDTDLITFNKPFSSIIITAEKKYNVIISKNGKRLFINGIEQKKASLFIGDLKVVFFCPDDLKLIKGSPSETRSFMDIEIGKISKVYLDELRKYKAVLKQRNDLLKVFKGDYNILKVITEQLMEINSKILSYRLLFIKEINIKANEYYYKLAKGSLNVSYICSVDIDNQQKTFVEKLENDIRYKTTTIGSHRDYLGFTINNIDGKTYSSQGEIRTAVLVIKLALMDFIFLKTGVKPVILLDDCLSELDGTRQRALVDLVKKDHQTFITSTDYYSLKEIIDDDFMDINLKR